MNNRDQGKEQIKDVTQSNTNKRERNRKISVIIHAFLLGAGILLLIIGLFLTYVGPTKEIRFWWMILTGSLIILYFVFLGVRIKVKDGNPYDFSDIESLLYFWSIYCFIAGAVFIFAPMFVLLNADNKNVHFFGMLTLGGFIVCIGLVKLFVAYIVSEIIDYIDILKSKETIKPKDVFSWIVYIGSIILGIYFLVVGLLYTLIGGPKSFWAMVAVGAVLLIAAIVMTCYEYMAHKTWRHWFKSLK